MNNKISETSLDTYISKKKKGVQKPFRKGKVNKKYSKNEYARLAKTIQRITGMEVKYAGFQIGYSILGASVWSNLAVTTGGSGTVGCGILGSCITQGVQNNQMVGNNLFLRNIVIGLTVTMDYQNNLNAANPGPGYYNYRIVIIKPYNLTDFVANWGGVVNQRMPGNLDTPVDFQAGQILYDEVFTLGISSLWCQVQGQPFSDDAIPQHRHHKIKLKINKEYQCDPGSNIWSKDIMLFVYNSQVVGNRNIAVAGRYTCYYNDA